MISEYLNIKGLTACKTVKKVYCTCIKSSSYIIDANTRVSIEKFAIGENIYSFNWQDFKGKHENVLMEWHRGIPKSAFVISDTKHSNHPATNIFL